jgi:hypothetical protein
LSKAFHSYNRLLASISAPLTGSAVNFVGRIPQTDSAGTPGNILSTDHPIEVIVPPEAILAISDVKLDIDLQKLSGATFVIRNNSTQPLKTYSVSLDFYWDLDTTPLHGSFTEDGSFLHINVLKPGEQTVASFSGFAKPNKPAKLTRVVISLDYCQFADGTSFGPDHGRLKDKMIAIAAAQAAIQTKYRTLIAGSNRATIASQINNDLSSERDTHRRMALIQLQTMLKTYGPDGLAKLLAQ